MSSMVRPVILVLALCSTVALPLQAHAQEAGEWERARADLVAQGPGQMAREITRWQELYGDTSASLPFAR